MLSERKKESRLLAELAKTVIEAALDAEMVEHLDCRRPSAAAPRSPELSQR